MSWIKQGVVGILVVVLFTGMIIGTTLAQVSAQEVQRAEIKEKVTIPQKPVFDLTDEQIKKLTKKGIIKYYPDGTRVINLYKALKELNNQTSTSDVSIQAGVYRHAYMVTRWLWFDQYNYRGHKVYVKIPAEVSLNPETSFNLYNTHMSLPNGDFYEVGVGWFNSWGLRGLHLYAYDGRYGTMYSKPIPSGASRDIYLKVEAWYDSFYETNRGHLYGYDPYSGKAISVLLWDLAGLDHRIDETQEQHSSSQVWTDTPQAKHHDNLLKNQNGQWVDWNSAISTVFGADSPMNEIHGTENNRYYITTWCQT
jgi:hypothetical protein